MLAVVVSRADSASARIGDHLLALDEWTEHEDTTVPDAEGGGTYYRNEGIELRYIEDLHIRADGVAEPFDDPNVLFVASRHSGETGPLLTAHPTGNAGGAEFGGEAEAFARAAPNALAALIDAFDAHAPDGYGVAMECTHHGPTDIDVPSLFVELGSDEAQWTDPAGARAVARAILDCRDVPPTRDRQLVGFGGGHYVPRFERIVRETDWAVGHVLADWSLDAMAHPRAATAVIDRVFERSGARHAVVEGTRPVLTDVIDGLGYRVVSETWTRETTGVPLDTVDRLESRLSTVDDGLRFGTPATGFDGEPVIRDGPDALVTEATNIDADAARQVLEATTLAFETEEGGSRPAGRIALAEDASLTAVVRALAGVLETKYDEVRVTEEAVVAVRETFDPDAAATLGVDEGPAFGRLAAGEPVEVGGRTIPPREVHEREEVRFPLDAG